MVNSGSVGKFAERRIQRALDFLLKRGGDTARTLVAPLLCLTVGRHCSNQRCESSGTRNSGLALGEVWRIDSEERRWLLTVKRYL